jgi:hypothetical protein
MWELSESGHIGHHGAVHLHFSIVRSRQTSNTSGESIVRNILETRTLHAQYTTFYAVWLSKDRR